MPVGGRVGENLRQVSGKKTIIGTYYIKNIFNKRKKEKRKNEEATAQSLLKYTPNKNIGNSAGMETHYGFEVS